MSTSEVRQKLARRKSGVTRRVNSLIRAADEAAFAGSMQPEDADEARAYLEKKRQEMVRYVLALEQENEMAKAIDGKIYDSMAVADLRKSAIEMRDASLKASAFDWAISLSHIIVTLGLMHERLVVEESAGSVPSSEGFFWAKLVRPTRMPEGEDWVSADWDIVSVFDNNGPIGSGEELMVFVPGIGPAQRLDSFKWGPRIIQAKPQERSHNGI